MVFCSAPEITPGLSPPFPTVAASSRPPRGWRVRLDAAGPTAVTAVVRRPPGENLGFIVGDWDWLVVSKMFIFHLTDGIENTKVPFLLDPAVASGSVTGV